MPPVLGPSSLSSARLWSWADASGRPRMPSHRTKNDTSGPTRHSSTTTVVPAAPNAPWRMAASTASSASAVVAATVTPLPAARPSALTTTGAPNAATAASASSARGADPSPGGRHAVAVHERLGVRLAGLETCRGLRRSEDGRAHGAQGVGHPGGQRLLGADDGQVDGLGLDEGRDCRRIEDVERHVARAGCRPGVAGGADHLADAGLLLEFPGKGMLTPPAAEDQDLHVLRFRFGEPDSGPPNAMREEVSRDGRSQGAGR